MKKTFVLIAITALALNAWAKDVVKIGVILPLSGNNAQLGELTKPGIGLFLSEVAKGKYKHDYEVILEDDQLTSRITAQAANKLLNIDKVNAIVSFSSSSGNVLAPLATLKKVPHIAIASDTNIASKNPYNFIHWIHPSTEAIACADLVERYKGKRVAVISMRHQGVKAITKVLIPELQKRGITVVADETFNPGERDFRTIIARIKASNPEVMIPIAFSPEIEIILRQSKEQQMNIPMPTVEAYDFLNESELAEGQFYISGSTGNESFAAKLSKINKKTCFGAPYAYNALDMMRAAYETQDKIDHAAAAEWLAQVKDYPSAVGPISANSERFITSEAFVFKVENGKPRPASIDEIK